MKSRTCDFSCALGHILKYVRLAFTITFTHTIHTQARAHTHMHINGGMMRQLSLRVCCCCFPHSQKGYKWLRPFRRLLPLPLAFRVFIFCFYVLRRACMYICFNFNDCKQHLHLVNKIQQAQESALGSLAFSSFKVGHTPLNIFLCRLLGPPYPFGGWPVPSVQCPAPRSRSRAAHLHFGCCSRPT